MSGLKFFAALICSVTLTSLASVEGAEKELQPTRSGQQQGSDLGLFKVFFRQYWRDMADQVYGARAQNDAAFRVYYLTLQSQQETDQSVISSLAQQIAEKNSFKASAEEFLNSDDSKARRLANITVIKGTSLYVLNKDAIDAVMVSCEQAVSSACDQLNQNLTTLTSSSVPSLSALTLSDYSRLTDPIIVEFSQAYQTILNAPIQLVYSVNGSTVPCPINNARFLF